MANAFSYNGTDASGSSYGITVLESQIQIAPIPQAAIQPVAQWYGGIARSVGFNPLTIALQVICTGSTAADLISKLDALKALLDPRNGPASLALDWIAGRTWTAILTSDITLPPQGVYHKQFQLTFVSPDSRAFATTQRTSPDFTITTSPQTLTVESGPTAVAGNATADPIWIIKNTSTTATSITLNNTTTGESVTWTGSLPSGQWLRVDITRGVIELSTDSGSTWAASMTGVSGSFVLPTLKGGVVNSVTLTGIAGGTVTLSYWPRYL